MAQAEDPSRALVTVFGGTGFLGRRIVARLLEQGCAVRVAVRHPERARTEQQGPGQLKAVEANVRDEEGVAAALEGAQAAVNAVSLYVEHGEVTFQEIHVEAAGRVARLGRAAGLDRLVHVSGIGSRPDSPSPYVRSRAAGEAAVRKGFGSATLLRPSVLFGPGDAFLSTLVRLVRLPVAPLFGRGETRLQPVFVDDVAAAAAGALDAAGGLYELGGPRVYSYRELVETVARAGGRRPLLLPVPFPLWSFGAQLFSVLPNPPLTSDQLALLKEDNVADEQAKGLAALGVDPTPVEDVLPLLLGRQAGQDA